MDNANCREKNQSYGLLGDNGCGRGVTGHLPTLVSHRLTQATVSARACHRVRVMQSSQPGLVTVCFVMVREDTSGLRSARCLIVIASQQILPPQAFCSWSVSSHGSSCHTSLPVPSPLRLCISNPDHCAFPEKFHLFPPRVTEESQAQVRSSRGSRVRGAPTST